VGTVSGWVATMKFLDLARATLRTTFRPRSDLRPPRLFFNLRFLALKLVGRLRNLTRIKARPNGGLRELIVGQALRLPVRATGAVALQ
jgi:hypothetical protein